MFTKEMKPPSKESGVGTVECTLMNPVEVEMKRGMIPYLRNLRTIKGHINRAKRLEGHGAIFGAHLAHKAIKKY